MPTYSEEILRLAETTPVAIKESSASAELANRLCGDRVTLGIDFDGNAIRQVEWRVEGCAILKASVAFLARNLRGKEIAQARDIAQRYAESFETENEFRTGPLGAVYKLPARYKCALLPWQAFENLLRDLKR